MLYQLMYLHWSLYLEDFIGLFNPNSAAMSLFLNAAPNEALRSIRLTEVAR